MSEWDKQSEKKTWFGIIFQFKLIEWKKKMATYMQRQVLHSDFWLYQLRCALYTNRYPYLGLFCYEGHEEKRVNHEELNDYVFDELWGHLCTIRCLALDSHQLYNLASLARFWSQSCLLDVRWYEVVSILLSQTKQKKGKKY